jgi:hexulose-6-phosphate isomerase
MKAAINQWAFPNEMPATKAISLAKEFGADAFEVCVGVQGPVSIDATEADIAAIRRCASDCGIALTSVACAGGWDFPLSSPDPVVRERGSEITAKSLQIAQWLGVDSVLVTPGMVTQDTPYDVALENSIATIQDLVPLAERLEVCMALENVWNKFLLSPIEMRDFIDQFQSAYVGAYFDIGNIMLIGYPEQWIRILGKRIRMAHAKDFRVSVGNLDGFVMLLEGNVNWPEVMAAFRDIGYDKALVAELGPYAHSFETTVKHAVASLKAIVSM